MYPRVSQLRDLQTTPQTNTQHRLGLSSRPMEGVTGSFSHYFRMTLGPFAHPESMEVSNRSTESFTDSCLSDCCSSDVFITIPSKLSYIISLFPHTSDKYVQLERSFGLPVPNADFTKWGFEVFENKPKILTYLGFFPSL